MDARSEERVGEVQAGRVGLMGDNKRRFVDGVQAELLLGHLAEKSASAGIRRGNPKTIAAHRLPKSPIKRNQSRNNN